MTEITFYKEADKAFIEAAFADRNARRYFAHSGAPEIPKPDGWKIMLVAREGERQTGFVAFTFYGKSAQVYINDIYVAAAERGQGIGKALLIEAEKVSREGWDCKQMYGLTVENKAAEKMFKSAGYKQTGEMRKFIYSFGKLRTQKLFVKKIKSGKV